MLESELKEKCRRYAKSKGCRLVSVSPKGVVGYPDCDLLIPGWQVVKIEFKRPGTTRLRAAQERWAKWFADNEIPYEKVNDFEQFKELID